MSKDNRALSDNMIGWQDGVPLLADMIFEVDADGIFFPTIWSLTDCLLDINDKYHLVSIVVLKFLYI